MGPPLALLVAAALAMAGTACGTAGRGSGPASGASFGAGGRSPREGDGDGDVPSSDRAAARPSDLDDAPIREFGRPASAAESNAVATLVARYYAAAAAQDGAGACSLTYYILAESLPEEYGGPPGPQYLRGAGTCRVVLSRVFRHFHAQLAEPPRVSAVRVRGSVAHALLSWPSLPAGYIEAKREGQAWKIDRPLAAPLP